jgi:O-antigen/teichoic acid export membrane protein
MIHSRKNEVRLHKLVANERTIMDKQLSMGQTSATGSLRLFVGKVLSTVVLFIGTVVLGLFISEADYGLYAIVLIPGSAFLLFQDLGVGAALIRYCARYRALNKEGELRKTIVAGLTLEVATGLTLTGVSLLMANFIGSNVFGKPESSSLIAIASFSILATSLMGVSQSIFIGFERMGLNSLMMICQAVAYCALVPLLVYLGYGALGAVLGYSISLLAAGIIALALLYFAVFRKLQADNHDNTSRFQALKPLLSYGIPLAIGTIVGGLFTQFVSFMTASFVSVVAMGNYKIAANFAVLLTFLTVPISTVLFPAFSKVDPRNERQLLKTVFASSVKYTALLLVPATMAMIVLSKPIIGTVFGNKWLDAPPFLALYVTTYLFAIFGSLSWPNLFTAFGETRLLLKMNLLTLSIGIPVAFLLIPQFGMIGAILSGIILAIPANSVGLYLAWKRYGTKADFQASSKIFLASAIAAAFTYLFLSVFIGAEWARLATGLVIFLIVYLVCAPFIGAISQTDINNLRAMFSDLGIMSKILEIPFLLMEKVITMRTRSRAATE